MFLDLSKAYNGPCSDVRNAVLKNNNWQMEKKKLKVALFLTVFFIKKIEKFLNVPH